LEDKVETTGTKILTSVHAEVYKCYSTTYQGKSDEFQTSTIRAQNKRKLPVHGDDSTLQEIINENIPHFDIFQHSPLKVRAQAHS
jgi:hypothetical protein